MNVFNAKAGRIDVPLAALVCRTTTYKIHVRTPVRLEEVKKSICQSPLFSFLSPATFSGIVDSVDMTTNKASKKATFPFATLLEK